MFGCGPQMKQNIRDRVQDKVLRAQGKHLRRLGNRTGIDSEIDSAAQLHVGSHSPVPAHTTVFGSQFIELGCEDGHGTARQIPGPQLPVPELLQQLPVPGANSLSAPSLLPHLGLNRTRVWPWYSPPRVLVLWGSFHDVKEICSYKKK